jgi:hypothetical protein
VQVRDLQRLLDFIRLREWSAIAGITAIAGVTALSYHRSHIHWIRMEIMDGQAARLQFVLLDFYCTHCRMHCYIISIMLWSPELLTCAEVEQTSSSLCFVSRFMDLHKITYLLFYTNKKAIIVYIYSKIFCHEVLRKSVLEC